MMTFYAKINTANRRRPTAASAGVLSAEDGVTLLSIHPFPISAYPAPRVVSSGATTCLSCVGRVTF